MGLVLACVARILHDDWLTRLTSLGENKLDKVLRQQFSLSSVEVLEYLNQNRISEYQKEYVFLHQFQLKDPYYKQILSSNCA